jgi:hypothetical protein
MYNFLKNTFLLSYAQSLSSLPSNYPSSLVFVWRELIRVPLSVPFHDDAGIQSLSLHSIYKQPR